MCPVKYVQVAVRNCVVQLVANNSGRFRLPKRPENTFKMCFDPELDTSPYAACYFFTIIGILRSMIKLGRIDIIIEVLILSSHVALPREEHLDTAVHVMAHVSQRYNSRFVYDP